MSEALNSKELKGIGGWLVLFQIYIIMAVVAALQSILTSLFIQRNMIAPSFKPYYIVLLSAAFVCALVCMILFYSRRIAFRPMFIVYSIVSLVSAIVYIFYGIDLSYYNAEFGEFASYFQSFIRSMSYVSLVIAIGITATFIIAVYRSQRVKNTFAN